MTRKITYYGKHFEPEISRATILKLIQDNAKLYPDEEIHLYFKDLGFSQLELLQTFFKQYTHLVPYNFTLQLHDDNKIILIKGTGMPLKDYEEILKIIKGLGSKTDHPALQPYQFIDENKSLLSSPSSSSSSQSESEDEDEDTTTEDNSESDEPIPRPTPPFSEIKKYNMEEKIAIIECGIDQYKKARDSRPYVDFMILPLLQYTRNQKKIGADNFLSAYKGERMISSKDRKILKNGRLSIKLQEIFNSMGFFYEKSVKNGNELDKKFDEINQCNVLNCFKALLEKYRDKLTDKPRHSKYPFFNKLFFLRPAMTIEEEVRAIENLLELFSPASDKTLSHNDFNVLSQGSLAKLLNEFFKEYGKAFSEAIAHLDIDINNNNPIYSIMDFRSLVPFDTSESPTYLWERKANNSIS